MLPSLPTGYVSEEYRNADKLLHGRPDDRGQGPSAIDTSEDLDKTAVTPGGFYRFGMCQFRLKHEVLSIGIPLRNALVQSGERSFRLFVLMLPCKMPR
jgi:hypothetical protein